MPATYVGNGAEYIAARRLGGVHHEIAWVSQHWLSFCRATGCAEEVLRKFDSRRDESFGMCNSTAAPSVMSF